MLSKVRTTLVVIARQRSLANDGMLKSPVSRCPVSMPNTRPLHHPKTVGSTTVHHFTISGGLMAPAQKKQAADSSPARTSQLATHALVKPLIAADSGLGAGAPPRRPMTRLRSRADSVSRFEGGIRKFGGLLMRLGRLALCVGALLV